MEKLTHIIYIAYQPITKKFEQDFYIEAIIQEGFEVEYWDLSAIYQKNVDIHESISENFVKPFFSLKQLEKEIIKYKSALFIFHINYYAVVYSLFRMFSKQNLHTAFFARGALPFPLANQSLAKKFFAKFNAFKTKQYFKKAILNQFALLARKTGLIKPFTYVFYAGSESLPVIGYGYKYGLEKSKLFPVNSFDYDKYIKIKDDTSRIINEPYCVFLDVYLPHHPDFDLLNIQKVNVKSYYASLNNFFDFIEDTYKIKVVIAAHPKSNYKASGAYKERIVLKYQTAELIRQSEFVLSHASTSISFAVLFKKPIIFIYTNDIQTVYAHIQYPLILHFAKILNATCLNIDEDFTGGFKILSVADNLYDEYKSKFLTNPESENQLSENIVVDFLKTVRLTATDLAS